MQNKRALILLFAANSISGFATGITILAIPWYLISYRGDVDGKFLNTVLMGSITFATLFWGTYSGTLIDRYNRKKIFQIQHLVDCLILVSVAIFGFVYQEMPFVLLALVATSTIFTFNIYYPNLYAFVQEIFEPKHYRKVNGAIEIQHQVTSFLGMSAAGLLISGSEGVTWWPQSMAIERWELWEIFLFDGITYFLGFSIISLIPYVPSAERKVETGSILSRIKNGFRYLTDRKPLLIFGIASFVIFFTLLVFVMVVLPVYIHDYLNFDKVEGGLIFAGFEMVYAIGAVSAGLLAVILSNYIKRINLIYQVIGFTFLTGALYLTWSFTHLTWVLVAGGFFIGLSNASTRILRVTYIIRLVPTHIVGRVNAFFQVINVVMRGSLISILAMPFFSAPENGANVVYGLMIMGASCIIAAVLMLLKFSTFNKEAAYG